MVRRATRPLRRPKRGATALATEVLGVPVGVAVPIQRHAPHHVLTWCGVELAALALLILTGWFAALVGLAAAGLALLALAATNRRRLLAVTRSQVVVLSAGLRGRPVAAIGPAPERLVLPPPRGVGVAVQLDDGRWWVDRSAYARLRRARELGPARTTGGG
jgi:hypothetical protein